MWRFIIPFYYGTNRFVLLKGGAPVRRKLSYLRQTLESIERLGVHADVTVFVCNEASREKAIEAHHTVRMIDCPPDHLPMQTVRVFQQWFRNNGGANDMVVFNEDDQIVHLTPTVAAEIEGCQDRVVFSPHRWSRQFVRFRQKGRPIHYLGGKRGLLDNIDPTPGNQIHRYHSAWLAQRTRNAAYAACWFMRGSLFNTIELDTPDRVELESASYMIFDTGLPVLKMLIDGTQDLSSFMVDHLSGYDYNRRLVKIFPK